MGFRSHNEIGIGEAGLVHILLVHILLVEDDDRIAAALRPALHRHGRTTTRLAHGRGAVDDLAGVEVVLLDLGLPDVDGVDVCREIRSAGDVPVIVVSARGEVDDRILGLRSGADDYLVKPYDIGELVARVHAVYRRRRASAPVGTEEVVEIDGVSVDLTRHTVTMAGRTVALTRKEFQVLAPAGRFRESGLHPRPDRRRGVGAQLGGREPDPGRARGHAAYQARPPGAGTDRARRRVPPGPARERHNDGRPAAGDHGVRGGAARRGSGHSAGAGATRPPT